MNVLLVMEPPTHRNVSTTLMPPLGILSVASYLESRGIPCAVLDRNITTLAVDSTRYNVIGFSVNVANVSATTEAIRKLRAEQGSAVRIIAGGPFCLIKPELLIAAGADAVIAGEGEHTTYEYLVADNPAEVAGLYLPEGDRVVFTGQRPWELDLDQFPPPALNKVDLSQYRAGLRQQLPISSIFTSRGCPFNCVFCFHSMGHRFRARSPQHVADDIEWQVRELGVREICIEDDNFTFDIDRAIAICKEISHRSLPVRFQLRSGVRVDRVSLELCHALKAAGTWLVSISPETSSDEGLKKIDKHFSMADVQRAIDYFQKARLSILACFMVGFPWERAEDIQATIDHALTLGVDFLQVTRVRTFPGTRLYDMAEITEHPDAIDCPGFFQGDIKHATQVSESVLSQLIKQFYRRFYLRPSRLWKMISTLPPSALWELARYACTTRNV